MTRGMIDVVYDDKAASKPACWFAPEFDTHAHIETALEQYALTRKNAKTDYLQLSSFDKVSEAHRVACEG